MAQGNPLSGDEEIIATYHLTSSFKTCAQQSMDAVRGRFEGENLKAAKDCVKLFRKPG